MPLKPFDAQCFVEVWREILPPYYTEPIEAEADGAGFDVVAQQAAQHAVLETAMNLSQQAYYLRPHSTQTGPIASSGVKASGSVLVRRAPPALGAVVLPVGTVFLALATDSYGGVLFLGRYLATTETTLPEGSSGPMTVPVEAEFVGYTGNLPAGYVVAFQEQGDTTVPSTVATTTRFERVPGAIGADRFQDGLLGRYVRLSAGVPALVSVNRTTPRRVVATYTDTFGQLGIEVDLALDVADVGKAVTVEVVELAALGLTVEQPAPIEGGVADALAAIGVDRRQGKIGNETDEQFRARLLALPDVVSPNAIRRILNRVLTPHGIGYRLIETGVISELMGFTWDVHPWGYGGVCPPIEKLPGSEYIGQGAVWLGPNTYRHFFLICVEPTGLGDFSGLFGEENPPGYPNAWGMMVWGGFAAGFLAVIAQLWAEINEARAAGVGFWIVEDPFP